MSFPPFKDISKNANDLLKKGYTTAEKYSFRVEFDTTSSSGVQITPYLQRTFDNAVEGELKTKCACKDLQFTTTENLKQDVSFEFGAAKHTSRGLKWTVNVSSNLTDFFQKAKGKLTGELKNDYSNSSLVFETPLNQAGVQKSESKVTFNSVFGSQEQGLSMGVDTELSLATKSLQTFNAALARNKKDVEFSLFYKKKFGSEGTVTVGSNYVQKVESVKWSELQVGGEVAYEINGKAPSFALASSFKPSESSTFKGRFDSKGLLGFLYTEKWNGPLSVSFGADWNTTNADNPFQHSIKLAFK